MASRYAVPFLMRMFHYKLLAIVMLCAAVQGVLAAPTAGEVLLARGAATAQQAGESGRLLGKGSTIFEGDVVTTGLRSVAVLQLLDGTRITLRPGTKFQIESFSVEVGKESAVMSLFKGGLRAVTGFLSKRNRKAVRLRTAVATIGIRGTEFDARLCSTDCADEAKQRPGPAGRAGFVRGSVVASAGGGARSRSLVAGDSVYNGDRIVTGEGAYAVLAFRDKSRVTVLPNTEFHVENFEYNAAQPERGRSAFALLRGGLRAVSGLIGKRNRRNYSMRTPVATIGIRGSGFDLVCQGTCVNPGGPQDPSGDGLFADVWDGVIDFDGQHPTSAGNTVFLANLAQAPITVPALPQLLTVPRPNEVDIPDTLPPASSTAPAEGLYVSCYTGNCGVETAENVVDLAAGEASYVGTAGGAAEPLQEIPAFQAEDPVLRAVEFGEVVNSLDKSLDGGVLQCSVR